MYGLIVDNNSCEVFCCTYRKYFITRKLFSENIISINKKQFDLISNIFGKPDYLETDDIRTIYR